MARTIWKGGISFGLVNIPVKLYSAINEKKVSFHMLDKDGTCRLRQKLYCPATGKEYDYKDAARGVEIAPDQYIIIDPDEIEKLRPEGSHTIDIKEFVALEQIDPIYFQRTYYLSPDQRGAKAYSLLVEVMKKTGLAAIAKFIMRKNEYLAALHVMEESVIGLTTLFFSEDVRSLEDVEVEPVKVDKKELALAEQLVNALLSDSFQPEKYHNEYVEQLQSLIDEKVSGKEVVIAESVEKPRGKVVDLFEALQQSVKERKSGKKKTTGKRKETAAAGKKKKKTKAA